MTYRKIPSKHKNLNPRNNQVTDPIFGDLKGQLRETRITRFLDRQE